MKISIVPRLRCLMTLTSPRRRRPQHSSFVPVIQHHQHYLRCRMLLLDLILNTLLMSALFQYRYQSPEGSQSSRCEAFGAYRESYSKRHENVATNTLYRIAKNARFIKL
ncbi:hypothetical protein EVAR_55427_1 [Eumeta japonica]|uniref:Uncharacterized protein n=1 Tax=Eumeta variegata TaxID=151549 RepID=A0A4C1Z2R1_EUMVA|nr:hypothetical protein EVAR_55427_1 [Eumeta japonica]